MDLTSKNIQLQYQGYVNTPSLWKENEVYGLSQFQVSKSNTMVFNEVLPNNLRLGKRVERFVSAELNSDKTISILLENVQIQNNKQTIGEIDCIAKQENTVFHIEIIFKFYLFDGSVGTSEIEHWIGPNRNDTLLKKLSKLKEKQLPLLYNKYTQAVLEGIGVTAEETKQAVIFKAQLFVPYKGEPVVFTELNKDCVGGFYTHYTEISQFMECKFFIPQKINWLQDVQTQVNWLPYLQFSAEIEDSTQKKRSPLCWIKFPNGSTKKFFVVWWDC